MTLARRSLGLAALTALSARRPAPRTDVVTTATSVGAFTTLLLDINPTYTTSGVAWEPG